MSTITIPLPDEDFQFMSDWARQQGITVADFLAKEVRNLRKHLQTPLHSDLKSATGVLNPELEAVSTHLSYLDHKHA